MSKSNLMYKRNGMPLYGESVLNFILRVSFGVIFFWMLYYPIFIGQKDQNFVIKMSYIMIFSLIASLTALMLSYVLIQLITKKLQRPKKGFFDLNGFPNVFTLLYECMAVFLNALLITGGLILLLGSVAQSWTWFCLFYVLTKTVTRIIAYAFAAALSKSFILTALFYVMFFSLISFALLEMIGR